MKTSEARSVIYIDIETFAGEMPRLDSFTADGRLKDPVKIEADLLKKQDEGWRKQALSSTKGEVWCVGVAIDDNDAFCIKDESEDSTLKTFNNMLALYNFPKIVAHNGFDFDFLFLFHRGLKYGFLNIINMFSDKTNLVDTMRLLDGPSWKTMTSLDNMSKLLLGESAKGDITGADVHDLILRGENEKIINYCIADVNILRRCYKKLNEYGIYS